MDKPIKLYAALRDIAGVESLMVQVGEGATVRDLIETIRDLYPAVAAQLVNEDGDLSDVVRVYIHGRSAESLDTPIRPEDEVILVPPMVGG